MEDSIINKVAESGLITIDLEQLIPAGPRKFVDIKEHLFQGLILREKDFRNFIKEHNWQDYQGAHVALYCSADAIVPTWAYMLISSALSGIAGSVQFCLPEQLEEVLLLRAIEELNTDPYLDGRIVVKGCSKKEISVAAYVALTNRIKPIVKSIMYGEPCSTVPVYKRKT